jgi:ribonuclease HI
MLHVYSDGGLMKRNPSPYGGAYAWCHVDPATNTRVRSQAAVVLPSHWRMPLLTNNVTELVAAVEGIMACPKGEEVWLFTDNDVTKARLTHARAAMRGVPEDLQIKTDLARRHVELVAVVLVKGHPSSRELMLGKTKKGQPVSSHNVFVDRECRRVMKEHLVERWSRTFLPVGGWHHG